jgi:nucleotide-binding universal stress UspA family protein
MFQRILVPLDGSALAEIALGPASALAKRLDAELLLVSGGSQRSPFDLNSRSANVQTMYQTRTYLETAASLLKGAGMKVEIACPADTLVGGIARRRQFHGLELVVIAVSKQSSLERLFHLGTAWSGLVETSVPILVVKASGDEDQGQRQCTLPRFMTCPDAPIMTPLDGSALAESALPIAQEIARVFGNPLLLCRAATQPYVALDALDSLSLLARVQAWALEETLGYLHQKQQKLASTGLEVKVESRLGTPAECIEACMQTYQPGLVVMAAHGRSGLGRLMLGSIADRVLSQSQVPVLLVRIARPQMRRGNAAHSAGWKTGARP